MVAVLVARGATIPAAPAPTPAPVNSPLAPAVESAVRRVERFVPDFHREVGPRCVVVTDWSSAEASALLAAVSRTAEAVERFARECGVEPRRADEPVVAVAFRERARFESFARSTDRIDATWMNGYWASGAERIVVRRGAADESATPSRPAARRVFASPSAHAPGGSGASTAAHEAAHHFLHRFGVQRRCANEPLWLSEGLAIAFEPCGRGDGEAFEPQADRDARLVAALRSGHAPALRTLLVAESLAGRDADAIDLFYLQSHAVVRHLRAAHGEAFVRYLAALRDDAGHLSAARNRELFTQCFGDPDQVDRAWRAALTEAAASGAGSSRQAP